MSRLLDPRFKYRNSASTSVRDTFRRFGFKPTSAAERRARQQPKAKATVTPLKKRAA